MAISKPAGHRQGALGFQERNSKKCICGKRSEHKQNSFFRGIPAVFFIAIIGTSILAYVDAYDWFYGHTRQHEAYELDDIVAFLTLFFAIGLLWLVFRQYREFLREVLKRRESEKALHELNLELGERVEQQTKELRSELEERTRAEAELIDSKVQLRLLSSSLLTAQEDERRRISFELHDDFGQTLTLLKLKLQTLEQKLYPEQKELCEGCGKALGLIDQIIDNLRRLSHNLSPPLLKDMGLKAALRSLIEDFSEHSDLEISADLKRMDNFFSQKSQIHIYRIFQEALSNIEKHAEAAKVFVAFDMQDHVATFQIEDDGKGFDIRNVRSAIPGGRGMGLAAMNERAKILGGVLSIWSDVGKGTRVLFRVPIISWEKDK